MKKKLYLCKFFGAYARRGAHYTRERQGKTQNHERKKRCRIDGIAHICSDGNECPHI